jgi:periplasmic protein TonB
MATGVMADEASQAAQAIESLKEGVAPVRDRLTTTLFLVALFHLIVVLGVTFGAGDTPPQGGAPTLEVILVPNPTPESIANEDAHYLSQVTQRGAGNDQAARRPESGSPGSEGAPGPEGDAAAEGTADAEVERSPAVLVTRSAADDRRDPARDAATRAAGSAAANATGPAVLADDGRGVRLKGKTARELQVSPDTRESGVAVYLDRWRRRVEEVGTTNYPLQAARRRGLSGNPVLEVQILANGTLGDVILRRTSGEPELDRAALGILRLAAPFERFPPALAAKHDALRLAYEWQFNGGELQDTTIRVPATTR